MLARVAFRAATAARSVQPRVWNTVASMLTAICPATSLGSVACEFSLCRWPAQFRRPGRRLSLVAVDALIVSFAAMSTEAPKIDPEEGHIHGEREGLTGET